MKKFFYLLPLVALLFAASCGDDDDKGGSTPFALTIQAVLPEGVSADAFEAFTFKATNRITAASSVLTSEGLSAEFTLVPGQYDVTISAENSEMALNGVKENIELYAAASYDVNLTASYLGGGLVIKELYFTGVPSTYFQDAFYELYNNSNEVVYLDGIVLGVVDPGRAITTWHYQISQWRDQSTGELPDYYPLTSHIQCFPGTGTEHPLQPYTSVLVAANPINHTTENPNSTVNLANADFQLYTANTFPADVLIDGIPPMDFMTKNWGREMMPSTEGQSFIIAKLPAGVSGADYAADENNYVVNERVATSRFLKINASNVIDAVDVVPGVETDRFKTIRTTDDAGMAVIEGATAGSSAAYSGKSIRRKVKGFTADGKAVYKDTNNSSNDFIQGGGVPTPKMHATTIDE